MSCMNRLRTTLLLAAVLLVAAAIAGVAQPRLAHTATPAGSTITVSGNGTANGVPDQASFDFGVTTQASTATEALSRNAAQARAIVTALKQTGIDASSIQTTQVSLWPQTSNDGNQIVGYSASNSVEATVPIKSAGDTVDAAVGAGANNVGGPNLSIANRSSLYDEALKQALADAKTKAQTIAAATGLTLGGVVKVDASGGETPVPVYGAALTAKAAAAPPIEAGTQQVQASVTVTYSAS